MTPASARSLSALRPLQLAPGGQQNSDALPAAPEQSRKKKNKNGLAPSPATGLRRPGAAELGADLPKGRGRRAQAGTRHLSP